MERYNRNILVEGIGVEGQAKLKASKVLVIGAGGLGSPALYYLAAAGVGTIGIVEDDIVNITNLQRQILYVTNDIGRQKTKAAQEKLIALNPDVTTEIYNCRFTEDNAEKIIKGQNCNDSVIHSSEKLFKNHSYDFVVDCCDNFTTKLLINDVCVQLKKPFSHGAVVAMRGEVMTCIPGSACYRCVYENLPENSPESASQQSGILGPVAGIVGSIQASEAIKYLIGIRELITDCILITDVKTMNFMSLHVIKRSSCICSKL